MPLTRILTVCLQVFLLTGCALLVKPPADDERARFLLDALAAQNMQLKQVKGLANVRLASPGQSRSGRIAYAGVRPDKMRVELLNTLGAPLTSLAGDGEHISILSHANHKHYRIRQSPKALEPVIHLPLGLEDLQALLSGRVPLPSHAAAAISDRDGPREIIVLKNRWHRLVAKLRVDAKTHQIQSLEVYDTGGVLQYQIYWHRWKEVKGFTLPTQVRIESPTGQSLTLGVVRFWPNPEIAPTTFVLDLSRIRS
ncbi:MAG: lipoprotein insertase outer membrane protein LolB [Desulfobacteraceae bacterium]|jgi:outer membrane biogenesis lipoprotein LolB